MSRDWYLKMTNSILLHKQNILRGVIHGDKSARSVSFISDMGLLESCTGYSSVSRIRDARNCPPWENYFDKFLAQPLRSLWLDHLKEKAVHFPRGWHPPWHWPCRIMLKSISDDHDSWLSSAANWSPSWSKIGGSELNIWQTHKKGSRPRGIQRKGLRLGCRQRELLWFGPKNIRKDKIES